ncbi:MAG: DUF1553 domain-containing protein [Planctomycetaceae bacterium]
MTGRPHQFSIRRQLNTVLAFGTLCAWLLTAARAADGQEPSFDRDVLPILKAHCLECHSADTSEGGLRLDTQLHVLRGGDSGEATVVPGHSDRSDLIDRVTSIDADRQMPPDGERLSDAEAAVLRAWIGHETAWQATIAELKSSGTAHWSFQPVHRPQVPTEFSSRHPIDAFIRRKLAESGLQPSPTASGPQLIRRASLVLHGLPPTPERVAEFAADDRPNAWQRLTDELLDSPHFGERMATFWLDLVRFGETHGFETNRERPHAWRYRDWVIAAFNSDLPYDQFVCQQLAGDVYGVDVATGFLVGGPYDLVKGQDPLLRLTQRQDELADMINTTGTAFMGLTLGCARCHNHKFDPVTQKDYYALQAVFAGVNHADRQLPPSPDRIARLKQLDTQIADLRSSLQKYIAANQLREAVTATQNSEEFSPVEAQFVRFTILATNQGEPCLDELEVFADGMNVALATAGTVASSSGDFQHPLHKLEHINDGRYGNARSWISSVVSGGWVQLKFAAAHRISRIAWARDREGRYADRLATNYRVEVSVDGEHWQEVTSSEDRLPTDSSQKPDIVYSFDDATPDEASAARRQLQQLTALQAERQQLAEPALAYAGTFSQPGQTHRLYRGEPGSPREAVSPAGVEALHGPELEETTPEQKRRQAIADWIVSRDNPLTARVIVNRLWQFHFGTGLVSTASDFGANGTEPSHPELLDWLAAELMDHDWSLKHIHRLILSSETWQQSSSPNAAAIVRDAESRLLWRFPPRRMEAEAIRDSMLMVSGKLNPQRGGPGFSAFEIEPENVRHYFPKTTFTSDDWRRMVYMTRVRQERDAVFGVFDCPDFNQVVPQRSRSTTPLQALNLLNSHFVMQQAEFFAERLQQECPSDEERIQRAWQLCFSRSAQPAEVNASKRFISDSNWLQFCRALLNSNEFVFVP